MGVVTALALILACIGAGSLLLASAGTPERSLSDAVAGLTGLAVLTWVAGWLVLAGAYSTMAGWGLLALGCGALEVDGVRARARRTHAPRSQGSAPVGALALGLLSLGLAMGRAFGELAVPVFSHWDDWPAYWYFPRLLLESGGFVEPFSLRRLSSLGAAPFAQSFFWPGFRIAANGMTDAVLGQLLLWATVRALPNALSTRAQPAWLGEALALAALLVSLTIPSQNSQPTLLPMGGALVLILLTKLLATPAGGPRTALAWGLVAAWLIGLRTSNVAFPAGLWLVSTLVAARNKDRQQGFRLAIAGLVTAVGLLPWLLALWRSSGTPLYPLIAGNYRFEGGLYSVPLDGRSLIAVIVDRLWVSRVWIIVAVGALAALRPGVRLISCQVIVALVIFVAVSAAAMTGLDAITIHRYTAPFLTAGVVFFATAALVAEPQLPDARIAHSRWDLRPLWLCAGLTLWVAMPLTLPGWKFPASNYLTILDQCSLRISAAVLAWKQGRMVEGHFRKQYEVAQSLLPADARLLSAAEKPFLFRFDYQVVHIVDILGTVSPAPGMPFFEGPERLAQYLRALGYTHLAIIAPARHAVIAQLQKRETGPNPVTNIRKLWAYGKDFRDNTEHLASSYPVVYQGSELIVIDLHQPRHVEIPRQPAF